jgi:N-methylhydantoinase A/oxoprolinase/acetone carboxylase beta subunit
MNACLRDLSAHVIEAFRNAITEAGIKGRFFLTQNDGTLMDASLCREVPGPDLCLRADELHARVLPSSRAFSDAIVVDIGGTTSDVGSLQKGFPRQATVAVEVGGVRTNFRMPDVFSIGLGGGSLVVDDEKGTEDRPDFGRLPDQERSPDLWRQHADDDGYHRCCRPCRAWRQAPRWPVFPRICWSVPRSA